MITTLKEIVSLISTLTIVLGQLVGLSQVPFDLNNVASIGGKQGEVLGATATGNGIVIHNMSGNNQTDKPFTISRIFKEGDIRNFPQARVDGTPTLTQANVKSRWEDGSVKHVMVSFIATISGSGYASVDFVNQNNCHCDPSEGLSKTDMLGSDYNFDATMTFAGSDLVNNGGTVSARTILENTSSISNDYTNQGVRYWLSGPIVTQVILEDRSPNLVYDLAVYLTDARTTTQAKFNLHPYFIAAFYPSTKQVKVDYIVENSAANNPADIRYNVDLTLNGRNVYEKDDFIHYYITTWRKQFWSSGGSEYSNQPSDVRIDYNFPYLISTKAIPNFDLTKQLSSSAIKSAYDGMDGNQCGLRSWNDIKNDPNYQSLGDIGGKAQYCGDMAAPGGRPELGILPGYFVRYLYSMSSNDPYAPRIWQQFIGNAEASGRTGIHYRENRYTNKLAYNKSSVNAWGRPISLDARPTADSRVTGGSASAADNFGSRGRAYAFYSAWIDMAHFPSMVYVPYLITGDYYYLEELLMSASTMLTNRINFDGYQPGVGSVINPNVNGVIRTEYRGEAWGMRTLGEAAFAAPDAAPEKGYFTDRLNTNLAVRMGKYGITEGDLYDPNCTTNPSVRLTERSRWCFGYYHGVTNWQAPEPVYIYKPDKNIWGMHFLWYLTGNPYGQGNAAQAIIDNSKATAYTSSFQSYYTIITMGHLKDLGFDTEPLLKFFAKMPFKLLNSPSNHQRALGNIVIPAMDLNGDFFTQSSQIVDAYSGNYFSSINWSTSDPVGGYPTLLRAAVSYLTDYNVVDGANTYTGSNAWNIVNNLPSSSSLNNTPFWAYVPRGTVQEVPPPLPNDTTAPTISSISAGSITTTGATISWTTNEGSDTQVEYGLNTSYGSQTTLNASSVTSHSAVLSGLSANTTYSYRVKSRDAAGNLAVSSNQTFTTSAAPTSSGSIRVDTTMTGYNPSVLDDGVIDSTGSGGASSVWSSADSNAQHWVEVQFSSDTNIDNATVYWGYSSTHGKLLTSQQVNVQAWNGSGFANLAVIQPTSDAASHKVTFPKVATSRLRFYQPPLKGAVASPGVMFITEIDYSDSTVTPADTTAPTISSISAGSITTSGATVSWTTNEASDTQVEYGLTSSYGQSTSLNSSLVTSHSASLSGLSDNTTYHYRVRSRDAAGNLAVSSGQTFTTEAVVAQAPQTSNAFSAGDRVVTTSNLNVRNSASVSGNLLGTQSSGSLGTIVSGGTLAGGFFWWNVNYDSGADGWSIEDSLEDYVAPALPTISSFGASPLTITQGQSSVLSWSISGANSVSINQGIGSVTGSSRGVSPSQTTTYTITATNAGGSVTDNVTVNVNQPAAFNISNVTVTNLSNSSVRVNWNTSVAANSFIDFGLTTNVPYRTVKSNTGTPVTSHTVTLTGLKPCSKYKAKVISEDALSRTAAGSVVSFATTGCTGNASIIDDAVLDIAASTGGALSLTGTGKGLTLTAPTNFANTNTSSFQIAELSRTEFVNAINPPTGKTYANTPVYNLKSFESPTTTVSSFSQPISITYTYTDSDISGLDESSLKLYRYSNNTWSELQDCVVNKPNNTITCKTSGFSDVVLVGEPQESGSGSGSGSGSSSSGSSGSSGSSSSSSSSSGSSSSSAGSSSSSSSSSASPASSVRSTVTSAAVRTPIAGLVKLTISLWRGMSGPDVLALQKFLQYFGLVKSDEATGYFGFITEGAVKRFQRENNIVSSGDPATTGYGMVGPTTRGKINDIISGDPYAGTAPTIPAVPTISGQLTGNLWKGLEGAEVLIMQQLFVRLGYMTADDATGYYGNITEAAVKRFQSENGIVSSGDAVSTGYGAVGSRTRAAINAKLLSN